jgi:hypothetical protein
MTLTKHVWPAKKAGLSPNFAGAHSVKGRNLSWASLGEKGYLPEIPDPGFGLGSGLFPKVGSESIL